MMTETKKSALLRKIAALLNMTVENGASENEAMMAATMASKLMTEYNVSLSEVERSQTEFDDVAVKAGAYRNLHEVQFVAVAIARFTDTIVQKGHHATLRYFGTDVDTQIASYLTDMFRVLMDAEWNVFWAENQAEYKNRGIHGKRIRKDFMSSMARRLSERLNMMKAEQNRDYREATGRDLVVMKRQMVEDHFGMKQGVRRTRGRRVDHGAWKAGTAAGDRVNISSGVTDAGRGGQRLLG